MSRIRPGGAHRPAALGPVLDADEREHRAYLARHAADDLAARGVDAVAVTWIDTSGVTRVKAVPLERLEHAAAWGIGASPCFDTFLVDDSSTTAPGAGGPVGDLRLHPDLDRVVALAAQPGWAWAPADRHDQDGGVHPQCHRAVLRREVERLAALGYEVRAAFETEWTVEDVGGPAYGMARLTEVSGYLREVVRALLDQRVGLEQIHPEYSPGQFEVSVAARDPLAAADQAVLVRETVRAASMRAGLRASFAPMPAPEGVGNGGHVHVSVWRDGENLMAGSPTAAHDRVRPAPEGAAFTAGVLAHLPGLLALGVPSVAGYLRLRPSRWAGAYACWGVENREAALRLVPGAAGERERAANLEVKCVDGSAVPYLVMAGILAAGRAGLQASSALPEPVTVDPATRGDVPRLPVSLEAATDAFEADDVLRDALGEELAATVVAVRRAEAELFAGRDAAHVVAATRWRY